MVLHSGNRVSLSTGRRSMVPLSTSLECPYAEELQDSHQVSNRAHRRAKLRRRAWFFGTWNVRSLVDNEGSIDTARLSHEVNEPEDRRIDLVVRELDCYNIKVAALQETKWFGRRVYIVGECVVLTAGQETPQGNESKQRGEGVAIVLSKEAVTAWKAGGEQWNAWGFRIVKVSLGSGKGSSSRIHILSCYAPTFAVSRDNKDRFFDDLQQALDEVPPTEPYVVLGDFNAHVGSRSSSEMDEWGDIRGPHGMGQINNAGRELLNFLSLNEAIVCNTWFKKKDIHKQTWQHPKSKKWHCIDFAIIRKRDQKRCLDSCVKRGAECNTDHNLLHTKLRISKLYQLKHKGTNQARFDVSKLLDPCEDENGENTPRGHFQEFVCNTVKETWKETGSLEDKWNALKSTLTDAAKTTVGLDKRKHPDWFKENRSALEPLFQERNQAYLRWLGSGLNGDKEKFSKASSVARRMVREAKNKWFTSKDEEAQKARFGGKKVWQCIRDMQYGRRGLVPSRQMAVNDEEGNTCATVEEQQERWRRHFSKILNVQSQFSEDELEKMRQRPVRHDQAEQPTMDELTSAIGKLKNGKAGGASGVLPEMVKAGGSEDAFLEKLLNLVQTSWMEKKVSRDWSDAVLVPVPKKGDLHQCDNWRGIVLLDVVGKVVARIILERLQKLAEKELPESQ